MTDSEALRRLVRAGWRLERYGKGSHVILKRGAERLVAAVGRNGKHPLSPGQRAMVRRATGEFVYETVRLPQRGKPAFFCPGRPATDVMGWEGDGISRSDRASRGAKLAIKVMASHGNCGDPPQGRQRWQMVRPAPRSFPRQILHLHYLAMRLHLASISDISR